jgi:hypothetical protein
VAFLYDFVLTRFAVKAFLKGCYFRLWMSRRRNLEALGSQLGPVFFLTALFLINFFARIILSPLLPTIEEELKISHAQAGSLFFLISAGYVVGLLGSGLLDLHRNR